MNRKEFKIVMGRRITHLREGKDMDLLEFSKITGKYSQELDNIERGATDFESATLYILATGLDISMSYLVDIDNEIKATSFITKEIRPENIVKLIRNRMKVFRTGKRLTYDKVIESTPHKRQWLEKIENGKGEIRIYTLYKIAKGLGISLTVLVDIHDEHKTEANQ